VDFWAQHKDFILKVLAGVGVFLVALIARSITYGDELEQAQARNRSLSGRIRSMQLVKESEIHELQRDADRLLANARALTGQIGWDLSDDRLEQKLLRRIVAYTREFSQKGDDALLRAVEDFRSGIQGDLNSGFGRLRHFVRQELVEEAREKGIRVEKGLGFDAVTDMAEEERLQYLLQLELVARVARAAIDARVDSFDDVAITTARSREPAIPRASPAFLQEYAVTVSFSASQEAARAVLNRLEAEAPQVPVSGLAVRRVKRPEDHLSVELTLVAVAANPDPAVAFAEEKKP
jgi:hypothetical protein